MDTGSHPDPFGDAMSHGLQRAVQIASCAVTAAQVYVYQQRTQARIVVERDERTRRALGAQIRADRDAGGAVWARALDPQWLHQAGLFATARAWGSAVPFADRDVPWYEPAAASAMCNSEERLRTLHPQAMAQYDRLRADGTEPAVAMREVALLFSRPPLALAAPYEPPVMLDAGNSADLIRSGAGPAPEPGKALGVIGAEQERATAAERTRGTDVDTATDLQAGPDGQRIANVVGGPNAAATAGAGTPRAGRAARPWESDFPMPIRDVVAAAGHAAQAAAMSAAPAHAPARQAAPSSGRRP